MRWIYWADWSPSWVFGDSSENPDEEPKCKESSTLNAQKRIGNRRPITLPEEVQEQSRQLGVPTVFFGGETSYIVRQIPWTSYHPQCQCSIQLKQPRGQTRKRNNTVVFKPFQGLHFHKTNNSQLTHASCNEKNILLIYVPQMIEWQTQALCWLDVCIIELISNMLISMFFEELDVWFFISHFFCCLWEQFDFLLTLFCHRMLFSFSRDDEKKKITSYDKMQLKGNQIILIYNKRTK